jgi:hypothetical protein
MVGESLVAEKHRLLAALSSEQKSSDDVKAISGRLYNATKTGLSLTGCGNSAVEFAKATLAPLVTPETEVYRQLESDVFPVELRAA